MPLTPRFDELIAELDLENAEWHLKRTNAWTEIATQGEIDEGEAIIQQLLTNESGRVEQILGNAQESLEELRSIRELLVARGDSARNTWWATPEEDPEEHDRYKNIISDIRTRQSLETLIRRAKNILAIPELELVKSITHNAHSKNENENEKNWGELKKTA